MILEYKGKILEKDVLKKEPYTLQCRHQVEGVFNNKLILGENLRVMKSLLYDYNFSKEIDLVYIDPPFATSNIFKISDCRANTISSSIDDDVAYVDILKGEEYIEFLRERLILLRELMSEKSSIYLHIDYKIGHYVKIIMDEIFGVKNFRNDIARIKCSPKNFKRKAYGNVKDLILFYSKTDKYIWNDIKMPLKDKDVNTLFKKISKSGKKYTTVPLHAPGETKDGSTGQEWRGIKPPKGRHWRSDPNVLDELDEKGLIEWSRNGIPRKIIFAEEAIKKGKKLQDVWEFKDYMYPDYPTQKNLDLLKLIIKTSSDEGDFVLDCFAGSGTTIVASAELNRKWIGIDQSEHAIKVAKKKLNSLSPSLFGKQLNYDFFTLEKKELEQTKKK